MKPQMKTVLLRHMVMAPRQTDIGAIYEEVCNTSLCSIDCIEWL